MHEITKRIGEYDIWAMVAPDTSNLLAERVHHMLNGSTVVKIGRYLDHPNDGLEVHTSLKVSRYEFTGVSASWLFANTIEMFSFGCDQGPLEKSLWQRFHDNEFSKDHRDMTQLIIQGRTFDEIGSRITKRYWNQYGVCRETVLVPQLDPR